MKSLYKPRAAYALAAAAIAGISFTAAFAVPTYVPPVDSPLDIPAVALNSESALLDAFNGYLDNIQAALPSGRTLRMPNVGNTLPTPIAPLPVEFYAAVNVAIALDGSHAYEIAAAAIQYLPGKMGNIVFEIAKNNPTKAADAVRAGADVLPGKSPDAASNAIKGLLVASASNTPADMASAADDAINAGTKELLEKVAKAAVSTTKKAVAQGLAATAVANAMVDAVVQLSLTTNAHLYIDDIARGAVAGVKGFIGINRNALAASMIARLDGTALENEKDVANFVAGVFASSDAVVGDAAGPGGISHVGDTAANSVRAALVAEPSVGAAYVDAINTVAKVNKAIRGQIDFATRIAAFKSAVGVTEANHLYAAVSGAVQAVKGMAPDFVEAAFTDLDSGTLGLTVKKDIIAAAVTSNSAAEGKIVLKAVSLTGTNTISAVDAVTAAIPAGTEFFAGSSLAGLVKAQINTAAAEAVLHAAILAANGAGYQKALGDIALGAVKGNKTFGAGLIAKAVTDVTGGWEECVAATIAANDPANTNLLLSAQTAASAKGVGVSASVTLAIQYAQRAKGKDAPGSIGAKTIYDDAVKNLADHPSEARAAIFGAGAANPKIAVPLLAAALRNLKDNGTGPSAAQLLDYATSLSKKTASATQLAFETAQDALNSVDNLSDMLDHKLLTNPAAALDIATAAAAARPEYAHCVARIAGFRSSKVAGKIATAIVQFAQMRKTDANNPAAMAAIAEGMVLGIKDAKKGTAEAGLIAAAVGGFVKGVRTFSSFSDKLDPDFKSGLVGNTADFAQADGTTATIAGGTVLRRAKGTAGVVTGAVTALQDLGALAADLSALSAVAIKAAYNASKDHQLAIAQAAAQACGFVAILEGQTFGDQADIDAIVVAAGGAPGGGAIENAVRVGLAQVAINYAGAGAAGTGGSGLYAHHSGLSTGVNAPVTDISNF